MSKKRRAKKAVQAVVVDEVLAEGSGPHAIPEEEGVVAVRVSTSTEHLALDDGDQVVTAEAATEADPIAALVERKVKAKGRKPKQADADATEGEELQASPDGEPTDDGEAAEGSAVESMEAVGAESDGTTPASSPGEADGESMQLAGGDANGDALEEIEDGEDLSDGEAAVLPTSAATMDALQLKLLVEALVFASDKPLTVQRLRQLTRVADVERLEQALAELATDYEQRGLILHQVSGGYQFRTRPQYSIWVQQLIAGRPVRLSRAQLETLAIIAYRQPITRPEIDDIRGVDSSATLKLLLDRALVRVLGKKEEVGRPSLYGTTKEFLDFFSLGDLRELPTLREYSELSEESRKVMSARLGIDPDGGTEGGGSAPPSDGGPMDGGPMDGSPDGASMASMASSSRPPTDGDELGGETVQGLGVAPDEDDADLGGSTIQSNDVDGLGGETVQSMDGEGLDDATIGSGGVDQIMDEGALGSGPTDDTPPSDDLEASAVADTDELVESADPVIAAEVLAAADAATSGDEPSE